jgi:hypothetical protein
LSSVALSGRQSIDEPGNFDVLLATVSTLPASILRLDLSNNVLGDDGLECMQNALNSVQHSKSEIVCGKADRDDGPVLGQWDSPNPPKEWHGDKMPDESFKRAARVAFAKKHCVDNRGNCAIPLSGKVVNAAILAAIRKFILKELSQEMENKFVVAMAYQHKGFKQNLDLQGSEWYPTFSNSLVGAIVAVKQKRGWWREGQVVRYDGKKGIHQVKFSDDGAIAVLNMSEIDFCICETGIPIKQRLTSQGSLPALLKLDLSNNFIGFRGAEILTSVIRNSTPLLEELNLASNRLGTEGAIILSDFFLRYMCFIQQFHV